MVMQAKPLLWQTLSLTDRKINYKLTCINDSTTNTVAAMVRPAAAA